MHSLVSSNNHLLSNEQLTVYQNGATRFKDYGSFWKGMKLTEIEKDCLLQEVCRMEAFHKETVEQISRKL